MKKIFPLLAAFLLVSCGAAPQESSHATGSSPSEASTPAASSATIPTYPSAEDAEKIASGQYIRGRNVYELDKANKKLTCVDYGMDYNKLKNKEGTKVFEVDISFVIYGDHGNAISFKVEKEQRYLYVNASDKLVEDALALSEGQISFSSTTLSPVPEFVMPTYGSYVSSKEFTQDKVDGEGKRIPTSEGGYEKESFYLFLDLTATSAKIYVGENASSHKETPLHQVENYALTYNLGGLSIKIPHVGGEFNCSLTITAANEIRFNNSYEKHGDYSAAGTFVPVEA